MDMALLMMARAHHAQQAHSATGRCHANPRSATAIQQRIVQGEPIAQHAMMAISQMMTVNAMHVLGLDTALQE